MASELGLGGMEGEDDEQKVYSSSKYMSDGQWKMGLLINTQKLYEMRSRVHDVVGARHFYREADARLAMFPDEIRQEVRRMVTEKFGEQFVPKIYDRDPYWGPKKRKQQEQDYWLDKGNYLLECLTDVGKEEGYWGATFNPKAGVH